MPLSLKKILTALLLSLLLLVLVTALLVWTLAGTPTGTRWLAQRAGAIWGDTLAWQSLDGTLLGHLQVGDLQLRQEGFTLNVQTLTLDWRPGLLVTGVVHIDRIAANGIRVALHDTPKQQEPAQPFSPAALDLPVDVVVAALLLQDLALNPQDSPLLRVERIALSGALTDQQLTLRQLEVLAPGGELRGQAHVELADSMPLTAKLTWQWRLPDERKLGGELQLAGDATTVRVEHRGAGDLPVNLRGTLHSLLGQPSWELELDWPELPLTRDDQPLLLGPGILATRGNIKKFTLEGQGRVVAPGLQPVNWSLKAHNSDRTLDLAALRLTTRPYALALGGRVNWDDVFAVELHYRATASELVTLNPQLPEQLTAEGSLAARFESETLTIEGLDLALVQAPLRAQLQGVAQFPAVGEPRIDMALRWSALTWPLTAGAAVVSPQGELSVAGSVGDWKLDLAGQAMGQNVAAKVLGGVADKTITLHSLLVGYGENRLSASGQLAGPQLDLDWSLQAPDPGALLPGAAGKLDAAGQLSGSSASPRLRARLDGQQLQWQEFQLSQLQATLQVGLAAREPLRLAIALGPLQRGQQRLLDAARLDIAGTTADHQVELALTGASDSLQVHLAGGLDVAQPSWRGRIDTVTVDSTDFGEWRLSAPVPLSLAADRMALGETCLRSADYRGADHPEKATVVCAGGDWDAVGGAQLAARLNALPLNRLLPDVTGQIQGQLQAALDADGSLRGQGQVQISPGQIHLETPAGRQQLAHGGGELNLALGTDGLDATLSLAPVVDGLLQARVQLPQFTHFPLPEQQPLSGQISADLANLHGVQGWIPELEAVAGRLAVDLRLAGSLSQPRLLGEIALVGGAADLPLAGLQIRELELHLGDDPQRAGRLLLSGALRSGQGKLAVEGWLDPATIQASVTLVGDKLKVYDTPDARVQIAPDLHIDWADQTLRLRGRVLIPRADITPQLGLRPGTAPPAAGADQEVAGNRIIAPSGDVVIIETDGELRGSESPDLPFRLDSEVDIILGDKVRVSALGFTGDITGGLTLVHPPQERSLVPRGRGRLAVEGGTFRAFGQDLDIETGEVIFRNERVTEPEVNLRAVRWIDNDPLVSAAGVQVTGPADAPTMELFSRPQLDPIEIQSYLLTGHSAAGGDSVLAVGTYLHPKLYVGYGFNLLEETSEFDALYTITPRYGIGANVGEADNSIGVTFSYEH